MCGIAGYSLSSDSSVERTLAAQALLAGIAERGADAVGYASRGADGAIAVTKLRGGASALLDEIALPGGTEQALIHVRDYTKGHPEIAANNHPIRHGTVVGIHNGLIENDDAVLERYGIERQEPDMTVDSEAIFDRRGDAESLVRYLVDAASVATGEARVSAERMTHLPDEWAASVRARRGSSTGTLLGGLLANPVLNAAGAQRITGSTPPRTYEALERLVDAGVLRETTGGHRNRVWVASDVMDEVADMGERIGRRGKPSQRWR